MKMSIMEAKARACCNIIDTIFEQSYNCKIPQHLKDEHLKETLEKFGELERFVKEIL